MGITSVRTLLVRFLRFHTTLRFPDRPPKLVYLGLLHWVSLAKAHADRGDGMRFRDALASCLDAADGGVAVFPISDSIDMEVGHDRPLEYLRPRSTRVGQRRLSDCAVGALLTLHDNHVVSAGQQRRPIPGRAILRYAPVFTEDGRRRRDLFELRHPEPSRPEVLRGVRDATLRGLPILRTARSSDGEVLRRVRDAAPGR